MRSIVRYMEETELLRSSDKIPTRLRRNTSWVDPRQTISDWKKINQNRKHIPKIAKAVYKYSTPEQKIDVGKKSAPSIGKMVVSRLINPVAGAAKSMTDWQMKQMRAQANQPRST